MAPRFNLRSVLPGPTALVRSGLAALLALGCSLDQSGSVEEDIDSQQLALTVQSASCRVDYTVTSDWGSGFGADVKITNLGAAVSSWTLGFQYPSGQKVTSLWNGTVTQSGAS